MIQAMPGSTYKHSIGYVILLSQKQLLLKDSVVDKAGGLGGLPRSNILRLLYVAIRSWDSRHTLHVTDEQYAAIEYS